ncbi:MAG TPA: TetR/AcrR family transcriptional regulator [Mycobacterium sp.]|nr:TetR/AcrR family transcriptional regulator [Mycobacterium sp.]
MQADAGGRGRGRPVGSDSAETRAAILRAAREVINERGYEAATFQAIAQRAGFSRPTMHYYFHTKEQVYDSLQAEAYSIVSDCIAKARREDTLLKQLSAFVTAAQRSDFGDGSMMRFIITSRLELHRNPSLRGTSTPASEAVVAFYEWMVDDAIRRGEIPRDVDAPAVVNMLFAMFWGMGFFAGFVHTPSEVMEIAKQLRRLFVHGLLDNAKSGRRITIDPRAPAAVAIDEFGRTWPGLALILDVPAGQPCIAANGAKPIVVSGDFTGERVRTELYRAYQVDSYVEGVGRFDSLDSAARPTARPDAV